jgi:lipopolysaccharide export system protein LptA
LRRLSWALACVLLLAAPQARAEKADRDKPLQVEADRQSRVDIQNQVVSFNGNVVLTQGSLVLRADRIEVHQYPNGHYRALATGAAEQPVTFRQKRDVADEAIDARAERLDYDSRTETARFTGQARVQRLRGAQVADEVSGAVITYDQLAETFEVSGGAAAQSPDNPGGRVRAVLMPREPRSSPSGPSASAPEQVPHPPGLAPVPRLGASR